MMQASTLSISIARPWQDVYEAVWQPETFRHWASGLSADLVQDGPAWIGQGPQGRVRIRFTDRNGYGVMDHRVELPDGSEVYVPMRVVPNGPGCEVMLTLFRRPGVSDLDYAADEDWVRRDLAALKRLCES